MNVHHPNTYVPIAAIRPESSYCMSEEARAKLLDHMGSNLPRAKPLCCQVWLSIEGVKNSVGAGSS